LPHLPLGRGRPLARAASVSQELKLVGTPDRLPPAVREARAATGLPYLFYLYQPQDIYRHKQNMQRQHRHKVVERTIGI
jgi:hypothetical protein